MSHIEGDRVALRELRKNDIPMIHRWISDPEINRHISWGPFPQTLRSTERFVEAQLEGEDPLNRTLVISLREEGEDIGTTGCFNIDWRNRCAELAIVIGETTYLGRGYGREAVELLLTFSFDELDLHRIYLRVLDFNHRAIRTFRECGFVEEGRLRETLFRDGAYRDILIMAVLEPEHRSKHPGAIKA
jgi:RimJ/RimL family protein N-acetyltransferase